MSATVRDYRPSDSSRIRSRLLRQVSKGSHISYIKMPPSKSVSFSQEEDSKLAELVSQHPCIFDAEHKFYKNQGVRDNVWQKISEYMNKSREYTSCKRTVIIIT